jgi:thiol:disulfide interchange protein DsbD
MLIDFPLAAAKRLAARLRCSAVALCWSFAGLALSLLAMDAAGATGLLGRSDSAAVVENPQIRAELLAHAPQGLGPGRPLLLGLQLRHASGWHTYWKNPGDSGLATELQWTLPAGWQAAAIQWPLPQRIQIGDLANYGYEGEVLLPVAVTVGAQPPGTSEVDVKLHASWLVCRQECIPQEGDFTLRLPLRSSYAARGAAFSAALAAVPRTPGTKERVAVDARVDGQSLLLQARGLPADWQGKALNAFAQNARVFANASSPVQTDTVDTTGAPGPGAQVWQGGVWSARLPLSPQRTDTLTDLALVLARDDVGLQTTAPVQGSWPDAGAGGEVSPALSAALAINAAAPQPVSASLASWALALGAAFLGGLALNLMPCVLPVLAIKALGFATHKRITGQSAHAVGLAYTAGVMLSVVALGAALLALRAGGEQLGWGFQMQSPAVVAVLAVLFALIGLNLAGWMEFGTLVPAGWAGVQLRHPAADAFLSGVLAVAVASPCSAPFMGASLGLAVTLPAAQALGIFAALGLGLALPFALVSSLPELATWLPRPGAWMLRLRQFMAFPVAATVLWLLWVLGHMVGVDTAIALAALLLCGGLLVWTLGLAGRWRVVLAALAVVLGVAAARVMLPALAAPSPGREAVSTAGWGVWSADTVARHLEEGHPVFVDFTAAWCITCQYNKQTVLARPDVLGTFAAKGVTLLRADWTMRDPAISRALADLGRSGVPVYVLYRKGQAPVVLSEILSVAEVQGVLAGW